MYDEHFLAGIESGLRGELRHWGLPEATRLRLLTISENATFTAENPEDGSVIVLRVQRPGYHTSAEILAELAWVEALRADSIVETPRLIPRRDGTLLGAFHADGQTRHVVAFAFMPGREPDPTGDLTPWFQRLGAVNARLHAHSRSWARPEGFTRKTWDFETTVGDRPHWGAWRDGLGLTNEGRGLLARTVEVLARHLAAYGKGPERFGLVHADLRLANLLVEGESLGVIDFDDCGLSWFMYDFAAAVSFMEAVPDLPRWQDAWVEGYRTVAAIAPEDEAMLPVFVMLRRILLTAWIASHSETPTAMGCGIPYTNGTLELARAYLARHG
ncbi:MAG: phosphotransferase [Rhizobiaceae bacterium]|nr:phosphotransferase [Rhizobiaceae bacterium]